MLANSLLFVNNVTHKTAHTWAFRERAGLKRGVTLHITNVGYGEYIDGETTLLLTLSCNFQQLKHKACFILMYFVLYIEKVLMCFALAYSLLYSY